MKKIVFKSEYFNILDTLECGQVFRFSPYKQGFLVMSKDKCCYAYTANNDTVIECNDCDYQYFYNYFDLNRDYAKIVKSALNQNIDILSLSAKLGKGIRILNQDPLESLFSFIISQNNNIKRIKGIIEGLCASLGDKKSFLGVEYYAFPSARVMATKDESFYKSLGLGYRAEYIRRLAEEVDKGIIQIERLKDLSTQELTKSLISIYGVGPKVANCVTLFGFHKSDSFPVDTWIEKVYKENFKGKLKDRNKICMEMTQRFKEDAGYFQQYLFYYKRSLEKTN